MNKIALFTATPRSATALLIAAATNCPISHAAVQVDGTWYHASESTGKFSMVDMSAMTGRHCITYTFEGDLSGWLQQMDGVRYDWKGVFGWGMKAIGFNRYATDDPKKFYCFEAALTALIAARRAYLGDKRYSGHLDTSLRELMSMKDYYKTPVSGCDIARLFKRARFGRFV